LGKSIEASRDSSAYFAYVFPFIKGGKEYRRATQSPILWPYFCFFSPVPKELTGPH